MGISGLLFCFDHVKDAAYKSILTVSMDSCEPLGRAFIFLYTRFMIICLLCDKDSTDIKTEILFLCWLHTSASFKYRFHFMLGSIWYSEIFVCLNFKRWYL
jgi:hypothetical protein